MKIYVNPLNRIAIKKRNIFQISIFQSIIIKSLSTFNQQEKNSEMCKNLGILGGGKMAEAIISALVSKKVINSNSIHVYDVNPSRLQHLQSKYQVSICDSVQHIINISCDPIILAVKPQNVSQVAKEIKSPIKGLILSIVAGYNIEQLQSEFQTSNIIRSMPNTPAMVLEGITVWTATSSTSVQDINITRLLLSSIGEQVQVYDERYLDMATAISGSGPAYIFLVMESMIDSAVHMGFPREIAQKLVLQTIKGSALYAQSSPESITALRNNVTSPGGTTASALYELERGNFRTVISDGCWAAYRRALELGGSNPNVGPGRNKHK